jgi:creatinine amidohydrolase/Fe(II)-dependent formamide hydrolase-like protein
LPDGEGPCYPKTVAGTWYTIDWIKQVPKGYVGIPHISTAEKGKLMAEAGAEACAEIVRAIKRYDPEVDL